MHNPEENNKKIPLGFWVAIAILVIAILSSVACNPEKKLTNAYGLVAADAPQPKPENKIKLLPYFKLNFSVEPKTEIKTQYIKGDTETIIDSAALNEAKEESFRLKKYLQNLDTTKCPINVDSVLQVIERIKTNYAKAVARVDSLKTELKETLIDKVALEKNQLDIATLLKKIIGWESKYEKLSIKSTDNEAQLKKVQSREWKHWVAHGICALLFGIGIYLKIRKIV
jgi:hypothetical protein